MYMYVHVCMHTTYGQFCVQAEACFCAHYILRCACICACICDAVCIAAPAQVAADHVSSSTLETFSGMV